MHARYGAVAGGFVVALALAIAAPAELARAQGTAPAPHPSPIVAGVRGRATLEGRAVGPDGSPIGGAVVVTSNGGQAASSADGRFELAIDVPADPGDVDVTAVAGIAGVQYVAHAVVALTSGAATSVGTLQLSPATSCSPSWLPFLAGQPGANGSVYAFAVFDDGHGPALYAGGGFSGIGSVSAGSLARWDGATWSAVGPGFDSFVTALAVVPNAGGQGSTLFAAGKFTMSGNVAVNHIARWSGTTWDALGSGLDNAVSALASYDDGLGGGPALFAGGDFTTAGGGPASHIAKWDGANWSPVGGGTNGSVRALCSFQRGPGAPILCAGGSFSVAGGVTAFDIASWDGAQWSALGTEILGEVDALASFDLGDGAGEHLAAGGSFVLASGGPSAYLASWDGTSWSAIGGGTGGQVYALTSWDDGTGPALYVGGAFNGAGGTTAAHIARWNGMNWAQLGSGVKQDANTTVWALCPFDGGGGSRLWAGGGFHVAGDAPAVSLAAWDGTTWSGESGTAPDGDVYCLAEFDDGTGPALYVGGAFFSIGGILVDRIAKWDGTQWSALGHGIDGLKTDVSSLAVFDDGSGPALYAGGAFSSASGVPAFSLARWNGSTWSAAGGGVSGLVDKLLVFEDGHKLALAVAGTFDHVGGLPANNIAAWNGQAWSTFANGMTGPFPDQVFVSSLAVFDDGSGARLYAAGHFSFGGGVTAHELAQWTGTGWNEVGGGLGGGNVYALLPYNDGSGPSLFVGGSFVKQIGSVKVNDIVKWNGAAWSALGNATSPPITSLAAFDDGTGKALFAGGYGYFQIPGSGLTTGIAKWNGSSWSAMDGGLSTGTQAYSLAVFDDGADSALYVGGALSLPSDPMQTHLVRWGGCSASSAFADLGSGLGGVEGIPLLAGDGTLAAGSPGAIDLSQANPLSAAALFVSLASTPAPFKGGTLVPVPVVQTLVMTTSGMGWIDLPWAAWPAGIPAGTKLYFQYAIMDHAAVQGIALSHALAATTP